MNRSFSVRSLRCLFLYFAIASVCAHYVATPASPYQEINRFSFLSCDLFGFECSVTVKC
jgi:hypothetical protein